MCNMNLITILVTRSKSCHVKTLHTILRVNMKCVQTNSKNEIMYVDDNPYQKAEIIQECLKRCERVLFIDFGIGMDQGSIDQVFEKHESLPCLVFPGVTEGVDWGLFRSKVQQDIPEPVEQMGLQFDTEVGKKISDDIYNVVTTDARVWIMNSKHILKSIKDKKTGNAKIYPKMFEKFKEQGVKIYAFTASKLTMTYTHECISNILNAAGVKAN
jgi:hypothetical protein